MEIKGKLIGKLPLKKGVSSTGKEWESQSYIIEIGGQFPHKVVVEVFGSEKIAAVHAELDQNVTAYIDVESHEYSGKWFTSVRAWKIVADGESSNEPSQASQATQETETNSGELPF